MLIRGSRLIGQMLLVSFDGPVVTPAVRTLIEKYYVGNFSISRKNIRGASNDSVALRRATFLCALCHKPEHWMRRDTDEHRCRPALQPHQRAPEDCPGRRLPAAAAHRHRPREWHGESPMKPACESPRRNNAAPCVSWARLTLHR